MFPEPAPQETGLPEKVTPALILTAERLAAIAVLIGFPAQIPSALRLIAFRFRFRNIIILRRRPRLLARTSAA